MSVEQQDLSLAYIERISAAHRTLRAAQCNRSTVTAGAAAYSAGPVQRSRFEFVNEVADVRRGGGVDGLPSDRDVMCDAQ